MNSINFNRYECKDAEASPWPSHCLEEEAKMSVTPSPMQVISYVIFHLKRSPLQ